MRKVKNWEILALVWMPANEMNNCFAYKNLIGNQNLKKRENIIIWILQKKEFSWDDSIILQKMPFYGKSLPTHISSDAKTFLCQ